MYKYIIDLYMIKILLSITIREILIILEKKNNKTIYKYIYDSYIFQTIDGAKNC